MKNFKKKFKCNPVDSMLAGLGVSTCLKVWMRVIVDTWLLHRGYIIIEWFQFLLSHFCFFLAQFTPKCFSNEHQIEKKRRNGAYFSCTLEFLLKRQEKYGSDNLMKYKYFMSTREKGMEKEGGQDGGKKQRIRDLGGRRKR